nr:gamete and mating-type specific protein A isoform X3 [Parasteatoda tepidariorum]
MSFRLFIAIFICSVVGSSAAPLPNPFNMFDYLPTFDQVTNFIGNVGNEIYKDIVELRDEFTTPAETSTTPGDKSTTPGEQSTTPEKSTTPGEQSTTPEPTTPENTTPKEPTTTPAEASTTPAKPTTQGA